MAVKKEKEFVIVKESALESWLSDASSFCLGIGFIGLGWFIESGAMQWVGAIMFFVVLMYKGAHNPKIHRCKTIDEARQVLDKLAQSEGE